MYVYTWGFKTLCFYTTFPVVIPWKKSAVEPLALGEKNFEGQKWGSRTCVISKTVIDMPQLRMRVKVK